MQRLIIFKYIITVAIASLIKLFTACSLQAQANRFPSDRDNKVILELKYSPRQKIELPVREIEILDARFNQTYIGITTGMNLMTSNEFSRKDVIFPIRFTNYLTDKLKDWFGFSEKAGDKLVILVKKFRVNDNIQQMLVKNRRKEVLFLFSASFFLQRNEVCFKVGSVDKWFSSDHVPVNIYTNKNDYQEWLITNVLLEEIRLVRFNVNDQTVSFPRQEVDNGIRERLNLPVMNEKIRKGIYRTYQEFLLNKPSDTLVKMATGKSNKIVFLDNMGHILSSANTWAVCDGRMSVLMFGSNFYEIEVRNNTIRVRTFRKINAKKSVAIINDLYALGLISGKARKAFAYSDMPDYLDIDMDTGEFFLEEIIGPHKSATVTEAVRGY